MGRHRDDSGFPPSGHVPGQEGGAPHGTLAAPAAIVGIQPGIRTRQQQGAVVPLSYLWVRAQGEIARVKGDHGIGGAEGVGGAARPAIGRRICDEARSHRVPIEVPERGEGVDVIFHEARAVSALPKMTPAPPEPVEGLGGLGHEPAHGPAEGVPRRRLEEQVEVIRHQRIGVQRDGIGPEHLPQVGQEQFTVLGGGEIELPVIAPGHHVHRPPGGVEPGGAGHGHPEHWGKEIVDPRIRFLHLAPPLPKN